MEIGGIDIHYDGKITTGKIRMLLHHIREVWPLSVVSTDVSPSLPTAEAIVTVPGMAYVHKNIETAKLWDTEGYVPGTEGTLLAIWIEEDGLSFTTDEVLRGLVDSLVASLKATE